MNDEKNNDKVIALDIGEVCLKIDTKKVLDYFNFSGIEDIRPQAWETFDLYECGKISTVEMCERLRKDLNLYDYDDERMMTGWNLSIGEELPMMAEIIAEITTLGYRFIYFSNTSSAHILQVYRRLSFANLITGGIFSFESGVMKPHCKIYEDFEVKYGKPICYLDDREENIIAGENRDWKSHLFTTPEKFREYFFAQIHQK
ncbi:hypothetical protein AAEX28_09855 [Lentisphaerota bacterium WC36G]|nr:hypothetical protein LJT99_12690 [Lentisphaerae bacterium WC36]